MFGFSFEHSEQQSSRRPRTIDNEALYKVLGVDKDAVKDDIKKAFRKMAMKHHPDKGGSEDQFKEITRAYEILVDDQKRSLYDEQGEEGVTNDLPEGSSDIFDLFAGGRQAKRRQRRGEDVVFNLKVELKDLYLGDQKKLLLTRNIICKACQGKGGKGVGTCKDCKGHGIRVIVQQLGPGAIQQVRTHCPTCRGTGQVIAEKDKCLQCKGFKTVKESRTLEVVIEKGMRDGERIVFAGMADEAPDTTPGDVVVNIQQHPDPFFRREGSCLHVKKTITLLEALTSFKFIITHLDGRKLSISSDGMTTVTPGETKVVRNAGMPIFRNPQSFGDLYIELLVEFPKTLTSRAKQGLAKFLPGPVTNIAPSAGEVPPEEFPLMDIDPDVERQRQQQQASEETQGVSEEVPYRDRECRTQ